VAIQTAHSMLIHNIPPAKKQTVWTILDVD